jgi:hypothetical protein
MLTKWRYGFLFALMTSIVLLSACVNFQVGANRATDEPESQTGISEIDAVIATTLEGDVDELRSILDFTQTNCTFAEGLGGPPKCLATEMEGTPVEVLPFLGPEGHFIRKEDIGNWAGLDVSELFAVYQVSDKAYSDADYPAGEYAIVFTTALEGEPSITLQIRQGKIIRIDYGFGSPYEIPQAAVARFLLPPPAASP